jgi:uncharacterized phage protein (TIGR01671 family)
MREILFRAKAINREKGYHRTDYKNGDWVYGLITKPYDERFGTLSAEMRDVDGVNGIEVDYKTIGQYTGLTDKNGKKIFEGDILKIDGSMYYVKFHNGTFGVVVKNGGYAGSIPKVASYVQEFIEIIGNIHDNPKLLGGER